MLLSEERISHLSHLILTGLKGMSGVRFLQPEEFVLKVIQQDLISEAKLDEQIDQHVRSRLNSYSRKIAEGSPEWEILYGRFHDEELRRRGL